MAKIQLIIGLGNPGERYEKTRHNVGAQFVEMIAQEHAVKLQPESKFQGRVGQLQLSTHVCWLLIPMTYMNQSGSSIAAFMNYYKIPPEYTLVVHDDLDFPPGTIRFKHDGGHGGHNGLRDIIQHLHSRAFYRLRIGVGHPGDRNQVVNYVLNPPSHSEEPQILQAMKKAQSVLEPFLCGEAEKAIHALHEETN